MALAHPITFIGTPVMLWVLGHQTEVVGAARVTQYFWHLHPHDPHTWVLSWAAPNPAAP